MQQHNQPKVSQAAAQLTLRKSCTAGQHQR